MTLFANGHSYRLAIPCHPPAASSLPAVGVEMAGSSDAFVPVVGKVDTGAFRTFLNIGTAHRLGIGDIEAGAHGEGVAHTATNEPFTYYVHPVSVRIVGDDGTMIEFPLNAAFSEAVPRNLLGRDWLAHLCVAIDREVVHFLKD